MNGSEPAGLIDNDTAFSQMLGHQLSSNWISFTQHLVLLTSHSFSMLLEDADCECKTFFWYVDTLDAAQAAVAIYQAISNPTTK